jgi:hypothetical protein
MKFLGFVLAGVLAAGTNASAQAFSSSYFVPNSAAAAASAATSNAAPDSAAALPDSPTPSSLAAVPAAVSSDSNGALPAGPQGGPVRVYEDFNFQGYLGLTFFRFYEAPHQIQSRTGFDSSMSYYYHGGWLGVDGSLFAGLGSQFGQRSRFLFAGAGPRFRWAGDRALEYWGHVLVGGSHYTPQTAFGGQGAFAYEAGGGVDATAHHRRIAYRLEVDMVGTRYFGTYQYSPKASVGVVYKF